ncbi:MAG: hypothetical protein KAS71_16365, partial [Bacteroidales bacterium]|nr:hypothetical protein [Bacteroidales bacterium]
EEDYVEISNCLNKHEIDTSDINCLDKLKIRAFHLVQSSRKIASLLKVLKTKFSSDSNYKDTLGFLTNYGRLRNGIHSNFIFHGQKEVICLYDKITYSYKPNEPIIMEPLVEDTFYNNCKRLIGICIFIIENVVYEQKIYDPTYLITK